MKNSRMLKFFIATTILFVSFILIFSILGLKERTGYISEFNTYIKKGFVAKDGEYAYHARIKYNSKTFRNNDIYGVYPSTNNIPSYITSIEFDYPGSPYAKIISTKELKSDDRIDDVSYTLRVKGKLIFVLFLIDLFLFLILVSDEALFKNIIIKISDNKFFIPVVIILIILACFFKISYSYAGGWDSIYYIVNGISFVEYGRQLIVYPGTLFSIIGTFLVNIIFKNTQFSSYVYLQIIPISLTIIFTYKILKMFIGNKEPIILILVIFLLYTYTASISEMIILVLTDGWLLMFCVMVAYSVLKEKVILAGILVGIAHYYRASQAIPILIFAIVLLPKFNIKRIILYYASIALSVLLISFVLNLAFDFLGKDSKFYDSILGRIPFTALNAKDIFLDIINVFVAFRSSTILIAVCLIISLIGFIKIKDNNIKKLAIFAVLVSAVCFAGGLAIQKVFGSREETLRRLGENRYFMYALLFSSITAFIYMSKYFKSNNNLVLNYIKRIVVILIIMLSFLDLGMVINKLPNFKKSISYSDYSEDYPLIEKKPSILSSSYAPGRTVDYIFKPYTFQANVGINKQYEIVTNFNLNNYIMTNSMEEFDYIFSFSLTNESIIDGTGTEYIKVWQSSLSNSIPYSLFKRSDD